MKFTAVNIHIKAESLMSIAQGITLRGKSCDHIYQAESLKSG
jgi:hypothetical protein